MKTREITVGLVGNPNCGKTTIFNALTGARQKVANWSGVTVEKREGRLRHGDVSIRVIDLPGIYSLTSYSMEEIITRDFIIDDRPDVIVNVVDAGNLETQSLPDHSAHQHRGALGNGPSTCSTRRRTKASP